MNTKMNYALAAMIIGMLMAGQTFAGKPPSAGKPSATGGDRGSEQRGQPERTRGSQRDAVADEPSAVDSDRDSEQRRQSERTRDRQRDAVADEPSAVDSDRNSEQRRQSERTRDRQRDAVTDEPSLIGSDRDSEQRGRTERTRDDDERSTRRSTGTAGESERHEYFRDQHRAVVRDFYGEELRRGHCPPGLAKRQNGCMPPGLAKKWTVGQQLPRDVIFHNLPTDLTTQLGQPPAGHRYVRVADEILLIRSRNGMVIDAIPMITDVIQGRINM